MRSAVDVMTALLATLFVAIAFVFATGIGLAPAQSGPTEAEPAHHLAAHDH